ncbi:MAG TPA: GntR family transcriptional regulator [Pseudonocardiaceae bacterium]|nr:GntR family transcriptional regulator [Pseudonocardiaceae bacterium]
MDHADPRPAYQRVADDLRHAIANGAYQPGDQLPTLAELTARYNIAVMTARDAIRQLTTEGLVVSRQGKGAYVLRQPSADESITLSELLDLLNQVSRSVDDLTDRMAVVERTLAPRQSPTGAPQRPTGD